MPEPPGDLAGLLGPLDRLRGGDSAARDELIAASLGRLRRLARRMAGGRRVRAMEGTDDILQEALVRLSRSLADVQPETVPGFLGLAAEQIRRALIDLDRRHFGRCVHAEGRAAVPLADDVPAPESSGPVGKLSWGEFHEAVTALPGDEGLVFRCRYYHGMPETDIATALGVSERTVIRRWTSACVLLRRACGGRPGGA